MDDISIVIVKEAVKKGIVATARDRGIAEEVVKNLVRESLKNDYRKYHENELKLKKLQEKRIELQLRRTLLENFLLELDGGSIC